MVQWSEKRIEAYRKLNNRNIVRAMKAQDNKCFYCSRQMYHALTHETKDYGFNSSRATIEHRIPKCLGGSETWKNKVMTCDPCNNMKGQLSEEEYLSELGAFDNDVLALRRYRRKARNERAEANKVNRDGFMIVALSILIAYYETAS